MTLNLIRTRQSLLARVRSGVSRLKRRTRQLAYYAAVDGRTANAQSIAKLLVSSHRPVRCPLIMVSQVERSGGSLVAQLFDDHPEVLAHPHELKFGYPQKRVWPQTDVRDLDEQFRLLFELNTVDFIEQGYTKGQHNEDRMNFFLVPHVQREVFRAVLSKADRPTSRQVLDAYFTSYFNAWLNLRNRIDQAKYLIGFVPMMAANSHNMDEFWRVYPDGYLILILRSPLSWYPSFRLLKADKPLDVKIESAAARWNESTGAMFRERARHQDRVIVLKFDELVKNTEATMRLVCQRIGLDFHPALVRPTFNGEPMASNSSFGATKAGVVVGAPSERESHLSGAERDYLTRHCIPLYERALQEVVETA